MNKLFPLREDIESSFIASALGETPEHHAQMISKLASMPNGKARLRFESRERFEETLAVAREVLRSPLCVKSATGFVLADISWLEYVESEQGDRLQIDIKLTPTALRLCNIANLGKRQPLAHQSPCANEN